MRDMQTQTEELPPPTQNDAAVEPEQQAVLGIPGLSRVDAPAGTC